MELNYSITSTPSGDFLNFAFNGQPITVRESDGYWNLTEMTQIFNKRINDFLRLSSTKKFIAATQKRLIANSVVQNSQQTSETGFPATGLFSINPNQELVEIVRGGDEKQGTWGHCRVALKLAAWLDADFEAFVYEAIERLLAFGEVKLSEMLSQSEVEKALLQHQLDQLKYERDTLLELFQQSSPWLEDPDDDNDEYLGPIPH